MDKLNSGDVAIVFWTHGSRGQRGEVTRFDCLKDAIQAVMDSPLSNSAPIAWIRTADRHFMMNDIRQMAGGRTLASRLAQVAASAVETAKSSRPARAKRFWWPGPAELGPRL
jgi:hypothetical protein